MITALAFSTIEAIDRCAWNNCFPEELEDWDYYRAIEQAGIVGFQWRYLALYENDVLMAAAVAFTTAYSLDSSIQGLGKHISTRLRRWWPSLFEVRIYALGSPVAEQCHVATARHVGSAQRPVLLAQLLVLARNDADQADIGLLAVKDASHRDPQWLQACREAGLQSLPGLPNAELPITFGSVEAYLGSLGKSTRKDLRRTLRERGPRVEWRRSVQDLLPRMMQLYEATLARSELACDHLPAAYLRQVVEHLDARAACVLYWQGEELVAFNLVLLDKHRLVDKFFAHDPTVTREHNLYVRKWLANVDYCIEHRIAIYECGTSADASKLHLGCSFIGNTLFFRHRNRLFNYGLRLVKMLIRADRSAPAMVAAISETR
ncbi:MULTISPECIES: GNAT family N-acetyltransferase [unclassified Pseudomonas]|uniref:GNAT family N-acetyltransferase n=1 Tax=unclassified Pseudomonas TaxID=196821 RepID=UPI002AC98867|nr:MULTISPECIES: GNAT family N-acetyltransferase [unclassified Pseudomonas]MEB0045013.1 GNAT family N-acetyltransferase [Pseudomonas sp. Dout3]MEB0095975.1 GNAT family N-acetyltransferase [Pseudomonas sp. DC1.2]WPX57841.1 GNAT family N-acetyltransferase [Pseudomonas sp. DC1.2]